MSRLLYLFLFIFLFAQTEEKTFYCEYIDFNGGIIISVNKEEKYIIFDNENFSKDWAASEKNITVYKEIPNDVERYSIYFDRLIFNFYTGELNYTWQHSPSKNKNDWDYIISVPTNYICKEAKNLLL